MNFLSYDIEIYEDLPEGQQADLTKITPSVAALTDNEESVSYYYDIPYMTKETAIRLVNDMFKYHNKGYKVFGWNILAFDFPLIAHYSGEIEKCSILALNSIDPMFIVVCNKGHFLGLDAALIGAGLATKTHTVSLKDGSVLTEMSGALAPKMWRDGEIDAVNTYLKGDVVQPLRLAFAIEKTGGIKWTSKAGRSNFISTKLLTVKECLSIPQPDVSWMTNPKPRKEFYDWIPKEILDKELN